MLIGDQNSSYKMDINSSEYNNNNNNEEDPEPEDEITLKDQFKDEIQKYYYCYFNFPVLSNNNYYI